MTEEVRIAFERKIVRVPLASILPLKQVPDAIKKSIKYRRIAKSIAEIGIIEPIVVSVQRGTGKYLLLDGHMRYTILLGRGVPEALCLVASDDEGFTYNKRISRLSTVQEHFMLVRALEKGVSEEKLARTLGVDVKSIKRRKTMLDGIAPEVVDLLKDWHISTVTFETLRKMKAIRQIECAELMISAGSFSAGYAQALLAATRQGDLAKPEKPKNIRGMTPEDMARLEREMATLQRDFKGLDATYGDDVLALVIATGYLSKVITNTRVERYLQHHHAEILGQLRAIVSAASLDRENLAAV